MNKKYKLLKNIIGAEAGTIFNTQAGNYSGVELVEGESLGTILDLIACIGIHDKEWFEEIEEVKSSIYGLKRDDIYYYIGFSSAGLQRIYECKGNQNGLLLNARIEIGEAFLTKEEAETELAERKALATIKKWSWENDSKNINNGGWYMELNINGDYIVINEAVMYKMSGVQYYTNHKISERAFKELEAEYKILFNIK